MTDALLKLLRDLTVQVKFASLEQFARGWLGGDLAQAKEVILLFARLGLVERADIEVRAIDELSAPLFYWSPDNVDPSVDEFEELADRLARRLCGQFHPVTVYYPTRSTANLFGLRPRGVGRPCEWTHDSLLTEVFVWYRTHRPAASVRWLAEGAMPMWGRQVKRMKDPDAFLIDSRGCIEQVIEVAGKYSVSHLRDFHRHCAGGAYERLADQAAETDGRPPILPYDRVEIGYELW